MLRNILVAAVVTAFAFAVSVLPSQELPKTTVQPREAQQPTISDSPPIPARRAPARKPQLTDPPTDELNRPITNRDIDPDDAPPKTPVTGADRKQNPDLIMSSWIALGQHEEIALAEIASRRANSTEVRLFAKMMVDEHQAFLDRLQPFTPAATLPAYLNTDAKDARQVEETRATEPTRPAPEVKDTTSPDVLPPDPNSGIPARGNRRRPGQRTEPQPGERSGGKATKGPAADVGIGTGSSGGGGSAGGGIVQGAADLDENAITGPRLGETLGDRTGGTITRSSVKPTATPAPAHHGFNVVQIERELAVQSLASSKMLLNERTGPEFDQWFLAQQVSLQKCLRDQLVVYQRHVSPELARVFAQGERTADDHLARASKLLTAFTDKAVATDGKHPVSIRAVADEKPVRNQKVKD